MELILFSSVSGTVIPIESVGDPAFSEKMMGDGLAVRPALSRQSVLSPAEAVVSNVSRTGHAVVLTVGGRLEVLIHIGIDTVNLGGEGFTPKVKNGETVTVGQELVEVDFAAVSQKAPSVDVITIITNLTPADSLVKTSRPTLQAKEELFSVMSQDAPQASKSSDEGEEKISGPITVLNAVGIHARPALALSQIAAKYPYVRLKKGDREVNAKSIAALMGLNVAFQDQVRVVARGPQAQAAIDAITAAIKDGLGEAVKAEGGEKKAAPVDFSKTVELPAVVASPGLVAGKIHQAKARGFEFPEKAENRAEQLVIFNDSLLLAEIRLKRRIAGAGEKNKAKAEIFQAHVGILKDEDIVENSRRLIAEGCSAAAAFRSAIRESAKPLEGINNPILKERLLDFKDVEHLMLLYILGLDDSSVDLPENTILAAAELSPADLSRYCNATGFLMAGGSATSHAAIILRNLGIPALAAAGESVLNIPDGMKVIVDANSGTAIVNPTDEWLADMKRKQEKYAAFHRSNIEKTKEPAVTSDGLAILVKGNISNVTEAQKSDDLGAEGVGLFRTEFMFMGGVKPPEAETHRRLYQEILDAMPGGGPITFRLLDVGGDKPIAYMEGLAGEENPIMGRRGVRNYPINLEIIRAQIRGLLSLKPLSRVKIMIPMVAQLSEYQWVKKLLDEEKAAMRITEAVELGVMVEVPSLALTAATIAKEAAFFSIGTNDLSQYTLAMDRGNSALAAQLNNLHPAILRLIGLTAEGGKSGGIATAVCGAMASELLAVPMLVGLGVTELSAAMNSIPDVKALVRQLSAQKCREVAQQALLMSSAEEVEALIRQEFGHLLPF